MVDVDNNAMRTQVRPEVTVEPARGATIQQAGYLGRPQVQSTPEQFRVVDARDGRIPHKD